MCGVRDIHLSGNGRPAVERLVREMARVKRYRGAEVDGSCFDGPLGFGIRRMDEGLEWRHQAPRLLEAYASLRDRAGCGRLISWRSTAQTP